MSSLRQKLSDLASTFADSVLDAIRTVTAGEALLSPAATRAVISTVLAQPSIGPGRATAALAELTPRELEILTLVGLGLANDDIARKLFISPATAKTHVNRTMMKLHARDRAQLVIAAYESGLITPGQQAPRRLGYANAFLV